MVFPNLLNILCRFLFVNIRPKITSTGNSTALPKLEMAMLLKSADSPFKFVILRRNTILPIDWPVLYSKISQYKKNTILIGANSNEREYSKLPLIMFLPIFLNKIAPNPNLHFVIIQDKSNKIQVYDLDEYFRY